MPAVRGAAPLPASAGTLPREALHALPSHGMPAPSNMHPSPAADERSLPRHVVRLAGEVLAAVGGHLKALQWARQHGCPWNMSTCSNVAWGGHLAVLRWARAQDCPWSACVCEYAARNGHQEVLQWARVNDCRWDKWTCCAAARGGHLAVLRYAREHDCPWDAGTCHYTPLWVGT